MFNRFKNLKKNYFNLNHDNKFTCSMGDLVPVYIRECYPGETYEIQVSSLIRLMALQAPIYHDVNIYCHFFFVPTRLVFDKWEDFITGGKDGNDTTEIPVVRAPEGGYPVHSLWDYIGAPTEISNFEVLALPFRAYNLIYNEIYRDEDLQDEVVISKEPGLDTTTNMQLLKRCWQKDYFTKARPFEQKGNPVKMPLGGSAPVILDNTKNQFLRDRNGNKPSGNMTMQAQASSGEIFAQSTSTFFNIDPNGSLLTDLSEAEAPDISELRFRLKLQEWFETNMIAGSRYVEQTLAMFGAKTGDARLQIPEFIGGVKSPLLVSEVLQNSETTEDSPLGNMAGHAFSAGRSRKITKWCPEHGYILGLFSILPQTAYMQGSPRFLNRKNRFDFMWPMFANLSYQEILNKEIYAQGTDDDDGIFGFTGRYDELRSTPNEVHGEFKKSLKYWHMARLFNNLPVLNEEFVEADPTKRIYATPGSEQNPIDYHCICRLHFDEFAIRPIPKISIPQL